MRESIEEGYQQIFKHSERLAAKLRTVYSENQTVARQRYRNNVQADCPQTYSLLALAIPLLDTLISEMKFRFNSFAMRASAMLLLLVPSILCGKEYSDNLEISLLLQEYGKSRYFRSGNYVIAPSVDEV